MGLALRKRYDPDVELNLEIKGHIVKIGSPGISIKISDITDQIRFDLLNARTRDQKKKLEERIAYANYFVAVWRNKMEDNKKLFVDDFITAEQFGVMMTQMNCDVEFVEMRILLAETNKYLEEKLKSPEPVNSEPSEPLLFSPSAAAPARLAFWDLFFAIAIILALYFLLLHIN